VLEPLRGQDWQEILQNKPNPLNQVVDYICERGVDVITINELYEIYKVITGDKMNNTFIKNVNNFSASMTPLLENKGYTRKTQVRVQVNQTMQAALKAKMNSDTSKTMTQTTVFHTVNGATVNLVQDVSKYITDELLGTTTRRVLIYD
jgi:uncharacterized Fe-S center protein